MSVTASLIAGQSPQLVQIVVDDIPDGAEWVLTGAVGEYTPGLTPGDDLLPSEDTLPYDSEFTPGGYSWTVPGGYGVGDGGQVVLVDNRTPGNVPFVYTLTVTGGVESSNAVEVPFPTDMVLQSLDGQRTLPVELLDGSLDVELPVNAALFRIPGRARPVTRFDVLGDVVSTFKVMVPVEDSARFRALIASGEPVLYRLGASVMDFDPVSVMQLTSVSSVGYSNEGLRVWDLGYALVDDPYADVRLGAFTWDQFDDAFATWGQFDAAFTGLSWDDMDRTDWANA